MVQQLRKPGTTHSILWQLANHRSVHTKKKVKLSLLRPAIKYLSDLYLKQHGFLKANSDNIII